MTDDAVLTSPPKAKKSVALSGVTAGNTFFSSSGYMDCMVSRGYAANAIGDPLGTPATDRYIGGY